MNHLLSNDSSNSSPLHLSVNSLMSKAQNKKLLSLRAGINLEDQIIFSKHESQKQKQLPPTAPSTPIQRNQLELTFCQNMKNKKKRIAGKIVSQKLKRDVQVEVVRNLPVQQQANSKIQILIGIKIGILYGGIIAAIGMYLFV